MVDVLRQVIASNAAGARAAIPSVCSAQPDVIRASLLLAEQLDRHVVIEATSNQVNQDGGYTGMRAADFIDSVFAIADRAEVDRARIIFGGDHLGPQAWRALPARAAMDKAHQLVREFVAAGFHKIHLDCSEGCAGEDDQLDDAVTAKRSAALAKSCAAVADDLLFVIGTEVPPPGGARTDAHGAIAPTCPAAARATLEAHLTSFGDLADQIGGLVVQPGVEFTPSEVIALPIARDPGLRAALVDYPRVTLEAHSTDYQTADVFPRLAELGFAFQKVGPALTHAYRDAIYALDAVRAEAQNCPSILPDIMEELMLADPQLWRGHYHGDAVALKHLRHHGLADRIRYYWPRPKAQQAVAALLENLSVCPSETVLLRHLPQDTLDRAARMTGPYVQRLIDAHVQAALAPYFFAETTA